MQYLHDFEIRQLIQSMCMMNNRFLNLMLEDNIEAAQVLLRVTLKDDKIKVIRVQIQDFIQNLYGHSAQLDILAQDADGRYFNVEIQRSDEGADEKRARYYSSILDTHFLRSGRDYKELPDSYVIFITEHDVLKEGRPIYTIDRYINESGKCFNDGSKIVYVNSQCRDDTPLGRLMQDMYCTDPVQLHYKEFASRMEQLKNKKGEDTKMRDLFEEYAQIAAKRMAEDMAKKAEKETRKNTLKDMAIKMLKRGDSVEEVVEITSLPIESVRALQVQLS